MSQLISSSVTGFLVSSQTIYGSDLGESAVRFAQRKAHHESKQPILVIYTNDGSQRTPNFISPKDQGMNQSYNIKEYLLKQYTSKFQSHQSYH